MRFKIHHLSFLLVPLLLSSTLAQSDNQASARLFIRYEDGAAYNRIGETILSVKVSMRSEDRTTVAIRVCSKEPIAFALATASADPFLMADLFHGYGYPADRVIFLRSEDCLSKSPRPATEIWTIPEKASLPSHVEAFKSSQIRLISLGGRYRDREMPGYRTALKRLIQNLRAKPSSVGVVVGYFLHKPSPALRRRIRDVRRILKQSGLPPKRYLVHLTYWPDEVSTYPPDQEPSYPNVFIVEVERASARR